MNETFRDNESDVDQHHYSERQQRGLIAYRLSYIVADDPQGRLHHLGGRRVIPAVGDTFTDHQRKQAYVVQSRWIDYYADGLTQVTLTVTQRLERT